MRRKRPCRICRRWFLPHPRSGDRQRVCSGEGCQRERHRQACADWHARNPDYDREGRLRRRLAKAEAPATAVSDPIGVRIDAPAARDAVGVEVFVFVEETAKVVVDWARDAVLAQARRIKGKSGKHGGVQGRDAIGGSPLEP